MTAVEFEREAFTDDEITRGLDQSRQRIVARFKGKLVREERLAPDSYRGSAQLVEFLADGQTLYFRNRVFFVGHRQFQLSVIGSESEVLSEAADGFFESFRAW
ncbi:MAG: hypothetical protein MI920_08310 [Kiloniellales bacterium]|nr:hypothetical protein [Kiloniellales bacterium]